VPEPASIVTPLLPPGLLNWGPNTWSSGIFSAYQCVQLGLVVSNLGPVVRNGQEVGHVNYRGQAMRPIRYHHFTP
jgi:hypothetical protein